MTLDEQLAEIYADALVSAIKRYKSFFKKIQAVDSGKIKPPKYYVDRGLVAKWRQGFVRELLRQDGIIDGIMNELNKAGLTASQAIRDAMADIYSSVRSEAVVRLSEGARMGGKAIKFSELTRQEMAAMIQEEQSPFSKIAYQNLGQNTVIRRRLQASMSQAILLGESQQEMVKRIRKITGQAQYQAQRVAQTENTRVQSQATMQASQEAEKQGVRVYHEWSTRMVRSRDTHIALNGKKALAGEVFPGSVLRYPGDPNAPAREVINCHCRLIEHVLLSDEDIVDGRVVKKALDPLNNQGHNGIIKLSRNMAGGLRQSPYVTLKDADIVYLKRVIKEIGANENVFVFNLGVETAYYDDLDIITVVGNVYPSSDDSPVARDRMSERAVLAHEYWGHRQFRGSRLQPGDWKDEFRASYRAAIDSPGLTEEDRSLLMQDALDRAKEAGVKIKINERMRRMLYGY